MDIVRIATKAKKTLSDNSPVLLTAVGVAGTITTAYLAAKASFKASKKINDKQFVENISEKGHPLTGKEKFKLVWPLYLPAVGTGALTCTCIIGANYIGTKRAAALAAAYTISQEAMSEYKTKVLEKVGEKKEQEVRDAITKDRIEANPPTKEIVFTDNGDVLILDAWSGRYFMSTKTKIENARNEINAQINKSDYAALSEFYSKIGLEHTTESDEVGWNTEAHMEILWSTAETPDNKPCLAYDFGTVPFRGFGYFC